MNVTAKAFDVSFNFWVIQLVHDKSKEKYCIQGFSNHVPGQI